MTLPVSDNELLFWTVVLLLAYTYLGYPMVMWVRASLRPRHWRSGSALPTVTLVVVVHNEAGRIERRLRNLLSLDYPADRVDVVVASDGSTDATAARARTFERTRVTVLAFERRRGKPAVLNDVVPRVRGDIVVLADARQHFERGSLRALVAPFIDPEIGAVSGELMLASVGSTPGTEGVGLYWQYEKTIRRCESLVDSTIGATGAIYAIRRHLFEPIPEDTLLDDVLVPLRITQRGARVVFVPGARAWDRVVPVRHEFARKVRTIAGNFQLLVREPWLLSPTRNRLWFQVLSHKGLRLVAPVLLVTAFMTNLDVELRDHLVYRATLAGQLLFYAAALAGWIAQRVGLRLRVLGPPYVFCVLTWATVVAFARFVTGRQAVTWQTAVAEDSLGVLDPLAAFDATLDPAFDQARPKSA
jgi:poly-beta-1,6-N-acetyl-D-glucosamine synthase